MDKEVKKQNSKERRNNIKGNRNGESVSIYSNSIRFFILIKL